MPLANHAILWFKLPHPLPTGTPALTSRTMKEEEMKQVAAFIGEGVRVAIEAKADLAAKAALEVEGEKPPASMTNLKV